MGQQDAERFAGSISRRRFVVGGTALGGAVLLGGVSACGGDDESATTIGGTTARGIRARPAAPRRKMAQARRRAETRRVQVEVCVLPPPMVSGPICSSVRRSVPSCSRTFRWRGPSSSAHRRASISSMDWPTRTSLHPTG